MIFKKRQTKLSLLKCFLFGHRRVKMPAEIAEKEGWICGVLWPWSCARCGYESAMPKWQNPPHRIKNPTPYETFKLGELVKKKKGSQWQGRIVGHYSTELTPEGYAVESTHEKGSVQIYPASALALAWIDTEENRDNATIMRDTLLDTENFPLDDPFWTQYEKESLQALLNKQSENGAYLATDVWKAARLKSSIEAIPTG